MKNYDEEIKNMVGQKQRVALKLYHSDDQFRQLQEDQIMSRMGVRTRQSK